MSNYVALYRKYRPNTFESIIGQKNVTEILKKQIINEKISHAYIFSGTRGTGKTSAAKVFSRAVNCLNPINGEPCNKCEACKSILNGDSTDVVEMDAASNNSVEDIRQIRNEVVYATSKLKYRVYIIDEVHMLTTSAFNALLKTLEEPPKNVIFILATTEQHKIPVTILSRCLRFEFSKITVDDICNRLKYVLNNENIKYEEEALLFISKLADGALRDALSILDRCLSETNEILTLKSVENIIGSIDKELIDNIVKGILKNDYNFVSQNIDMINNKGKDLRQFVYEIINKFLEILINSKDENEINKISSIIDELSLLDNRIKMSSNPFVLIKASFIRICNNNKVNKDEKIVEDNSINYINEINMLKNEIENLKKTKFLDLKENDINIVKKDKEIKIEDKEIKEKSVFKKIDKKVIMEELRNCGKFKLFAIFQSAKIVIENNIFKIIIFSNSIYNDINKDENKDIIRKILKDKFNIDYGVIFKFEKEDDISKLEKMLEDNNIKYINVD